MWVHETSGNQSLVAVVESFSLSLHQLRRVASTKQEDGSSSTESTVGHCPRQLVHVLCACAGKRNYAVFLILSRG